jgi:membrane protein YqaA with SNARE-associated domain
MDSDLLGLFLSSLVSSTLLPGGSEAYLAWLVSEGEISAWVLVVVAT